MVPALLSASNIRDVSRGFKYKGFIQGFQSKFTECELEVVGWESRVPRGPSISGASLLHHQSS